jgi:hypothetical protein
MLLYWPLLLGLHIQTCRFFGWGTICRISSLHSNMSTCGTWRRWSLIATMLYSVYSWYVQNVSTFPNTFAIVSPLICVFWIQLTRSYAVFSRIALVSHFCAEIQLSVKIWEKSSKILFHQKTHGARSRDEGEARGPHMHRGRGPALATPTWCEDASAVPSTSPFAYIYWYGHEGGGEAQF